ncbi:MAG: hypothetical protein PUE49_05400 [Eggerthellales bacterium]|nr:hypothetical protein [Eggerthellales bacterium]
MKTIAAFKWAMNPHNELMATDGTLKWTANRQDTSDDDMAAIKVAVDLAAGDEVVALTVDSGDLSFAAARGADRTVAISGVEPSAQPLEIAQALADAIDELGIGAVAIADCFWSPMVAPLTAGILGWPCIMGVDEARAEGDDIIVTRRFGTGTQDVKVTGKVILGVAARRQEEKAPSMRAVLQARKKPVDKADKTAVPVALFQQDGVRKPEAHVSRVFDATEDLDGAIEQFISACKAEGVL